jgi:aspartate/methionine/tyrosine aminotransferase
LICDEVFFDYPMNAVVTHSDPVREQELLTFVLNGLSKGAGLPQMKLSWILVRGSAGQRKESLERLEIIADTFLSVSTPVQHAATVFLEVSAQIRSQILDRIRSNHDFLRKTVTNTAIECLIVEGGWYVLLRLPKTRSEEDWVCHFLEKREVVVHPGYFYGFSEETFTVLSLLPKQAEFQEGVGRLLSGLD